MNTCTAAALSDKTLVSFLETVTKHVWYLYKSNYVSRFADTIPAYFSTLNDCNIVNVISFLLAIWVLLYCVLCQLLLRFIAVFTGVLPTVHFIYKSQEKNIVTYVLNVCDSIEKKPHTICFLLGVVNNGNIEVKYLPQYSWR